MSITWDTIVEQLQKYFRSQPVTIVQDGNRVTIKRDTCSLRIYWEDEPYVLIEAQEIADIFAQHRTDKDVIAASHRRVTTAGDPDPNMDCFNDYVWMINAFEAIPGLIILDLDDGKFMDEM